MEVYTFPVFEYWRFKKNNGGQKKSLKNKWRVKEVVKEKMKVRRARRRINGG